MMINKIISSISEALTGIKDGDSIMIGGFGNAGLPVELIDGLIDHGAKDLVVISNNAGGGDLGLAALLKERRVRKIICSFPRQVDSYVFDSLYRDKAIELELVPQGNLAERIRAAGAGIGGFYTPTGVDTWLTENKEVKVINGKKHVLEYALHADFALISAHKADRWGNLTYYKTSRNFGPIMATAAKCTVAQVKEEIPIGELDPEQVITPGIFVDRIVIC